MVHILLIIVTSLQVLTIVAVQTDYAYNSQLQFYKQFMTTSWNGNTVGGGEKVTIYDLNNLRQFVNDTNTNFLALPSDINFEDITLDVNPDTGKAEVEMVTRTINTASEKKVMPVRYTLTPTYLGPLSGDNGEVKKWLRSI